MDIKHIVLLILAFVAFAEGSRDTYMAHNTKWLPRHIWIWLARYPSVILLAYMAWEYNYLYYIIIIILSSILWQVGHRMASKRLGRPIWPSMWTKLFKRGVK